MKFLLSRASDQGSFVNPKEVEFQSLEGLINWFNMVREEDEKKLPDIIIRYNYEGKLSLLIYDDYIE